MGFGLCAFGYLLLMLEHLGLDVLGYALISAGFFGVASELKTYKGYRIAAICAAVALPFALFNLYNVLVPIAGLPALGKTLLAVKGVALAIISAVLSFAHGNSTARIAADGGAGTFALRARITAYITALYMAVKLGEAFSPSGLELVVMVGVYVVMFLNAWLLFTCFTTITTKRRAVMEAEIIRQETEQITRKKLLKNKRNSKDED
ncbi:MAG: hypothetical protein IJB65_07820 [Clostridia bacterium]|nr:hypothetical protein [Clostridia bacterium]